MFTVNSAAAGTLRFLHVLIVLFIVFGWIAPNKVWLIAHLIFVPIVVAHWKTNEDRCFLTDFEHDLNGAPAQKEVRHGFVKSLLRPFMKEFPPDSVLKKGIYAVTWTSWLISAVRLFFIIYRRG